MIFGRTDLRRGVSKAKFDEEVDFEVRSAVAPRKRREKADFRSENFRKQFFSASKFLVSESFETRFGKVSQV